jgi:hypothetical protein
MNRLVLALAGLLALAWSGLAMAQASSISTPCPVNYQCAFSAAETLSLNASNAAGAPGQPDAYVGYMNFDGSSNVTIVGLKNVNGSVTSFAPSGTCAAGSSGAPATITLNDSTTIAFVSAGRSNASAPAELDFILSKDANSSGSTTFSVRVGVCRSL